MRKILRIFITGGLIAALGFGSLAYAQSESLDDNKPKKKEKLIYIDFRDKPIEDFLKAMTNVLQRNILVDDQIRGKITIISNRGIPQSKVYGFFKSVLESKGYAVIEERNLIKVVPIKDAVAFGKKVRVGRDPIPESEISRDRIYLQVVSIRDAEAAQIANVLKSIKTKSSDVIVYNTTNTLVLSGPGHSVNTFLTVIHELDRPEDDGLEECPPGEPGCARISRGNVHIYKVLHHNAEKIAQVLVKLDNPEIISEAAAEGEKDSKSKSKRKSVRKRATTRKNTNKRPEKIKAVAHKETNSLIITATPAEFKEIMGIIKELDVPRKQVLLEVLIVEVSADSANSFGVDWQIGGRTKPQTQFNSGLAAESGAVKIDSQTGKADITGVNTLLGFSFGFLQQSKDEVLGLFNANIGNNNFNILSSPQVMTIDNEEAEINVGSDVPIITGQRTSGGGDQSVTINQFEYRPVGIKLKFTPHINKNDFITLDLFQEVKEIAGAANNSLSNPTFTKRDVSTRITVGNEQTIVIAGLISSNKSNIERKIPILGDIPVLGYLFKRTSEQVKKTNLLVFITPHILSDYASQKKFREKKKKEQREFYRRNSGQ